MDPLERLVGTSPPIRRVHDRIHVFSQVDATVLVIGERGTGKGLAVRCLHDLWRAGTAKLLSVNCAAVPEALAESELFGHRRGAFTGATSDREGFLLTAFRLNGGLLLDDVAELPFVVQPKLLHAVEERSFYPLGSDRIVSIANADGRGVRLYATCQPSALADLRPDLRDRLSTCVLELPPLRERIEDVLVIAADRMRKAAHPRRQPALPEAACAILLSYGWPGNVRQLCNVLDRALALAVGSDITPSILAQCIDEERRLEQLSNRALSLTPAPTAQPGEFLPLREAERRHIRAALDATGGNVTRAAHLLGLKRTTLQSRLRQSACGTPS